MCYAAGIIVFKAASSRGPAAARQVILPSSMVSLEGLVQEYPISRYKRWRFEFRADKINGARSDISLMAYVRDLNGASYGDSVRFTAALSEPFNYAAPGNLDWRGYLSDRGIKAEAKGEKPEIIRKAPFFFRIAQLFRAQALEVFAKNFPADQASVLSGIVMGEKKSVSEGLKRAFQDSGAMHLLVASGSNVGFVTFLIYFLCAKAGLDKKYTGFLALTCAGFYVAAAGLDPPLVRGYAMFAAAFLGFLIARDSGVFQGLVLACLAILVFSPRALFDAGFQMSFMAAYGIIVGMALWGPICRIGGFSNNILAIILVSFFAQIGLYPLMALYFHKVSLISILSNVALAPASGVIMGLGFLCVAASYWAPLFAVIKPLGAFAVGFFIRLVEFFASFEFSAVRLSPPSALTLSAFFIFIFALLHAPLFGFRNKKLYFAAAGSLLIGVFGTKVSPEKNLAAMFSDADTHSVILKHGSKAVFLVNPGLDGGKLVNSSLYYGFREIDGVFISTLARKDWSGLGGMAQSLGVKKIILPYGPLPEELSEVLSELEKNGGAVLRVWSGEALDISGVWVHPVWRGRSGGYGGNTPYEGLDWRFSGKDFKVAVEDDGRRAAGACGISGECRDFAGKKGELLEFEL